MGQAPRHEVPIPSAALMKIGMQHQTAGHLIEAEGHGHWHGLSAAAVVQAERLDGFRQAGHAQGRRVGGQQAEAMPARHFDRLIPAIQQQRVEGFERRREKLLARLGEGTLGGATDKSRVIAQSPEEIIEFALEALDEALGQTGHQHRKCQSATPGEISRIGAMGCNELI